MAQQTTPRAIIPVPVAVHPATGHRVASGPWHERIADDDAGLSSTLVARALPVHARSSQGELVQGGNGGCIGLMFVT